MPSGTEPIKSRKTVGVNGCDANSSEMGYRGGAENADENDSGR